MPTQRPRSLLVLGVLHLLFGGLGLVCGLAVAGIEATGAEKKFMEWIQQQVPADQQEDLKFGLRFADGVQAAAPWYESFATGTEVLSLVTSVVLVVAGVGLLRMAGWGRMLSLVYVVLSLGLQTAGLVTDVFVLVPARNQWLDAELERDPDQKQRVDANRPNIAEEVGGDLVGMIYPVIVLLIMLQPSAAAALRGEGAPMSQDSDERRDAEGPPPGYGGEPDDRYGPGRF